MALRHGTIDRVVSDTFGGGLRVILLLWIPHGVKVMFSWPKASVQRLVMSVIQRRLLAQTAELLRVEELIMLRLIAVVLCGCNGTALRAYDDRCALSRLSRLFGLDDVAMIPRGVLREGRFAADVSRSRDSFVVRFSTLQ